MSEMPTVALSVRQPWAFLIVNGFKDLENRSWVTSFRGPIWIHAGKAWGRSEKDDRLLVMEYFGIEIPADLPLGGIVGRAEIVGCVNASPSPWFTGPYGFLLENAQPVPFQACPGRLGFWAHAAGQEVTSRSNSEDSVDCAGGCMSTARAP